MLADVIVVIHLGIVIFNLLGVPVVFLGAAFHWRWVKYRTWRLLHLGSILFVAAEALFGIPCPLTVWEDSLRGEHRSVGFIERWVHRFTFYQVPTWVFTAVYVAFAALVIATWIVVPPVRSRHRPGRVS